METVVTGWGELRVGPYWALTRIVPGLVGEVGCGRGQALVWRGRLEQEEFLKKKKCKKRHSATGEFPYSSRFGLLPTQPRSAPHSGTEGPSEPTPEAPGKVCTRTCRTRGCLAQGAHPQPQRECSPWKAPHSLPQQPQDSAHQNWPDQEAAPHATPTGTRQSAPNPAMQRHHTQPLRPGGSTRGGMHLHLQWQSRWYPCPAGPTGSLEVGRNAPAEEDFRAQGVNNPQRDLTQCGGLNWPEWVLRVPSI